jgi:signal transduction histidine kinase
MGSGEHGSDGGRAGSFELLSELTARLASTESLDEFASSVIDQIAALGFGMVWMARFDEPSGRLLTIKEVNEGVDTTHLGPEVVLDARRPIGAGFRLRRMINIQQPDSLFIVDDCSQVTPPGMLTLPRGMYRHLRGSPFSCGPLLGSRGQPVGAIGVSSYRGRQPIPDELFQGSWLRSLLHLLGIATERAAQVHRIQHMSADLTKVQEVISRDARLKAVGELAAAVAHDLNNLSAISLLAASTGLRSPAAAREALRPIERANRAMGDLVARLQRVARAGAADGDGDGVAEPAEIVQDLLLMLGPVFREHSINVDVCATPVSSVRADPALLHQVILNLLLNARDALQAMPPDQRAVRVSLCEEARGVVIAVADTGPGIAPEAEARIFQPFVTTKGIGHLGLGLAASRASLERLGGRLTGRNAPCGGALFEAILQRASRRREPASPLPPARAARARAGGADILVVDDDPNLVDLIGAFLSPLGHRICVATTAEQAHQEAALARFDLVLCDVGMPQEDGFQICRGLRRSGFSGPIALMTGWDREEVEAHQATAGHDRLLRKPFSGADLIQLIESLLGS